MDDKTQWLNGFIAEVIDGWMITDLKRLLIDIPHRPGADGNCNFPIALYVFACIEFLGQLTTTAPLPKTGYTQTSIMGFIDNYFPEDFKLKLQPHRANFVNAFRNGLAHNYFAKYAGISRTENEPLQVNGEGMLILDADRFVEAFRAAIVKLKEAIKTNAQLAETMVDRYNAQYQDNRLRFQTTVTTTRVSGASLAHPSMLSGLTSSSSSAPSITYEDLVKTTTTMPPPPQPKRKT